MKISVRHDSQGRILGSRLVQYNIEFELDCSDCPDTSVTVATTVTANVDAEILEAARESIRDGFNRVLQPYALGADAIVHELVIDDIDLAMGRYATCTAYELEQSLEQLLENDPFSAWPNARRGLMWLLVAIPLYIIGLHPSSPWLVSTAALIAGTYVVIFKCILHFALAAVEHSVISQLRAERDDFP